MIFSEKAQVNMDRTEDSGPHPSFSSNKAASFQENPLDCKEICPLRGSDKTQSYFSCHSDRVSGRTIGEVRAYADRSTDLSTSRAPGSTTDSASRCLLIAL